MAQQIVFDSNCRYKLILLTRARFITASMPTLPRAFEIKEVFSGIQEFRARSWACGVNASSPDAL